MDNSTNKQEKSGGNITNTRNKAVYVWCVYVMCMWYVWCVFEELGTHPRGS